MPKKAKGLTRPISRKQARSYDRVRPNPGNRPRLGVTHLAEINGPGAYEARYRATRDLLKNAEAPELYTAKQRAAMKKMSPARKAAFKRMLDRAPAIENVRRRKKRASPNRRRKRRATPNRRGFVSVPAQITSKPEPKARRTKARRKKAARKRKLTKAERRAIALRNLRKAHRKRGTRMKRGRQTRSYGKGKYRALRARYGPRSRWTYKSATKKGRVRDIPDFALLGFKSAAAMRKVYAKGSEKQRAALSRKTQRLYERRERDAEKAATRIRAGRGLFTPNADDALSYEEWEEMRPNARRKKSTKKRRKKLTKAQRATISRRNLKKARAARRRGKGTAKRKSKRTRTRATRRRGGRKLTRKQRRAIAMRNLAKAHAKRGRGGKRKVRRKRRKARRVTGKKLVVYVSNRRRTRRRRSYKRNQGAYHVNRGYSTNRRRVRRRKSYRRNQGFMMELTSALKLGALVTAGFASHRALTHVIDMYGLSKIEALNTGAIAPYRGILSGLIGAGLGIGITMLLPLRDAKAPVAAGMAASFIHGALVTALGAAGASEAASYLSAYPDASGRAYGSYYTFKPHQVYAGMGSYYEIPQPYSGFGQPMLSQAAAGYGASPMLTQAAAGYGNPMLTQAAAGYGAGPMVTQAAAGTGEYVAWGVQGVGEYDEMPVTTMPFATDEGVYPNLHSAEQALSVAEASAGVGSPEIPLQSTVNPTMIADPIGDIPGGSRAGVFQGGDGIFG